LVQCGGCGEIYDEAGWHTLAVIDRIEPREVRKLMRDWPDTMILEARPCRGCGWLMVAKRPSRAD
jgi:hypothetical protein